MTTMDILQSAEEDQGLKEKMADDCCSNHTQRHFLNLPVEVLEHIWVDGTLDYTDMCRLSAVCSRFRDISNSNEVWKFKLCQRWPELLDKYPRTQQYDWRQEFCHRHECGEAVRMRIKGMSALYFRKEEVSREGFRDFADMLTQHKHASKFVIDELMSIVHDGKSNENLTEKYYAEKSLRFVQQLHLKKEWERFLELPSENHLLEIGAVMVAQWCQPTLAVTENNISDQLHDIANIVRSELRGKSPDHPANQPINVASLSEIQECLWSPAQSRQVLEVLNHVLYTKLGFRGNDDNYYDPKNSYINQVLQRRVGIPITLAIVYSSVALRLGVVCQPVNFPSHFLIKWKEHPMLPECERYTYIDVFDKGKFLSENECTRILDIPFPAVIDKESYKAISNVKVFERMARNLVNMGRQQGQMGDGLLCLRNAVELYLVICPDDMDNRILLARLYLHLNINLAEVMDMLQGLVAADRNTPAGLIGYLSQTAQTMLQEEQHKKEPPQIVPKKRCDAPEVKFSVGMIMKHRRYQYTCVIYGWDPQCEASNEWIQQMGVHNLPRKQYQPFYNVLVDDGSNRYAAQENLEMAATCKAITHPEVGKYFHTFCGSYYMANKEKAEQYPEDISTTQRFVQEAGKL